MAELQNPDPLVEAVAKARKEASRRPDLKLPTGRLNQIGRHVYAYSGIQLVSNVELTMILFQTQTKYIKGEIQYLWTSTSDEYTGDDPLVQVYINNKQVGGMLGGSGHDRSREFFSLIAPPYSEIKITMINKSSGTNRQGSIAFTGKAYDA